MRDYPFVLASRHPSVVKAAILGVLGILYNAYLIGCFIRYRPVFVLFKEM